MIVVFCNTCYMYSEEFEVNGIYYKTHDNEASVKGISDKEASTITIDETVTYRNKTYAVTSIGEWAFYQCSSLTRIELPQSITEIMHGAFSGCISLSQIELPISVKSIGPVAFGGCKKIKTIHFSQNVTSIDGSAFCECDLLSSIVVEESNEYYCSQNGILYTKGKETIVCCPMGIQYNALILYNVNRIGAYAFAYHNEMYSLSIPENIDYIGEYAFSGCSNIKELYIEDSDKEIELDAKLIDKCPIKTLYMGRDRRYTGHMYFDNRPFMGCTTLTNVTFGNSTSSIIENEFRDCINLSNVELGDGIEIVGSSSFSGCASLRTISLPDNLKRIEGGAFYGSGISSIIIPKAVENLGVNSFAKCKSLNKVVFDNSKAAIEEDAFYDDSNLLEIDLGLNISSIGVMAFYNCKNLKSITFPNSLSKFGRKAFVACRGLETIISEIEEPFEFIQDVFDQYTYDNATLYTPLEAISKYYDTYCWRLFKNIVEGSPSDINNVTNAMFEIKEIYNLLGQKGVLRIKGLHIIKDAKGNTFKIVR